MFGKTIYHGEQEEIGKGSKLECPSLLSKIKEEQRGWKNSKLKFFPLSCKENMVSVQILPLCVPQGRCHWNLPSAFSNTNIFTFIYAFPHELLRLTYIKNETNNLIICTYSTSCLTALCCFPCQKTFWKNYFMFIFYLILLSFLKMMQIVQIL